MVRRQFGIGRGQLRRGLAGRPDVLDLDPLHAGKGRNETKPWVPQPIRDGTLETILGGEVGVGLVLAVLGVVVVLGLVVQLACFERGLDLHPDQAAVRLWAQAKKAPASSRVARAASRAARYSAVSGLCSKPTRLASGVSSLIWT